MIGPACARAAYGGFGWKKNEDHRGPAMVEGLTLVVALFAE
jgi:hypothetical protein